MTSFGTKLMTMNQEQDKQQDYNNISLEEIWQNRLNIPCKTNRCNKLDVFNWLDNTPRSQNASDLAEVRFKNTRKEYFRNVNQLPLREGDVVAVEASPGHDIGIVSLTGELVKLQLKKRGINPNDEFKKIYRKAKPVDIDKWKKATAREHQTMIKSRKIAVELGLNMKIGDVEYQGDDTKAIFYYIADERVDFRELIKVLADEFKIRVEMKQIGARQEAGRIGGIGSCGRELCCSTWITSFVSVTTNSARTQELSLNPQKLAGQCGKLKCCLNYELDIYLDAKKHYPSTEIPLKTEEGDAYHQKTDIFKGMMYYATDPENSLTNVPLPVESVKRIQELNEEGVLVKSLADFKEIRQPEQKTKYENVVGQESVTRFDKKSDQSQKSKKKRGKRKGGQRRKKS